MKKVFIVIVIICILAIAVFTAKRMLIDKAEYKIEKINEYNYFIFKEEEKYGVIDKNGNIIIDASYSNVIIPNPEKEVFICQNEGSSIIVNASNQRLFSEYQELEPIKLKNVATALSYEKNTLIYKRDGLYGLIDFEGNVITKNMYESIENLQPTEGKFLVIQNGKKGVIDFKGNVIVSAKYDELLSDNYYTEEEEYQKSGFIVSTKTEDGYRYGYISYKGKKILEDKYNGISRILKKDNDIYLIVSENGKQGAYKNSKQVIEHEYASIEYDDNVDLLIVQKNKKYGVYTLAGKKVIDIQNEEITSRGIYIYAKSQNQNKVYDVQGNAIDMNFNRSIYKTENEKYKISTILNNNITYYGILDKENKPLVEENYRYIEYLYANYFIASDETGNLGIINNAGKVVLEIKYSSVQKIKGMNIVQVIDNSTNTTEIYSEEMKNILKLQNASIEIQKEYIIVSNSDTKIYLDNSGNKIENITDLKNTDFPDTIGEYKKQQTTLEMIYYTK